MRGPEFFVFIFVLCLYGVMVSQAERPPMGLYDIKKSPKYQPIENLQFRPPGRPGQLGRKFRKNDVKIAEK